MQEVSFVYLSLIGIPHLNEEQKRFSPRVTEKAKKGRFALSLCFLMCKLEPFSAQESL